MQLYTSFKYQVYTAAVLTRFVSLECQICGFKLLWPRLELMTPFWWKWHKDWIMKLACSLLSNWTPFWWKWRKDWIMKLALSLLSTWTPFWWKWHKDWITKLACSLLWNWTQNQNLEQKYSWNNVYVLKGDSTSSRHLFWGTALLLYSGVILHTELVPNQRSAGTWFWVGTKNPAGSMKLSVLVKKE